MIVQLIDTIFNLIYLLILLRILLSWLPALGVRLDPYNPIVRLIYQLTDPILEPFRRIIPPLGMIDISPIVAILVLQLVQTLLISLFAGY
ncbi:MAG: YggT family protein [Ardenticatenia bacterium]|uniref:YGGT family protein n=1 Tax=Ardenticatena maritima TaxID=872965 RepID=A0A0M9UCW8_9CHLR|nr:YggT family protein [Ardenticatena maritima]KPL89544.1 YGGT family protein [Ardenticatena maritima]RME12729.1 MAG: YggT family protein [Ardenticatenia bacterium]GAP63394.1 YggT family protein [Ardenticatena maritima]